MVCTSTGEDGAEVEAKLSTATTSSCQVSLVTLHEHCEEIVKQLSIHKDNTMGNSMMLE